MTEVLAYLRGEGREREVKRERDEGRDEGRDEERRNGARSMWDV